MATITTLTNIKVRDIITRDALGQVLGYIDKGEAGVTGMFGNLNIRPEYQREFVYPPKKREAVINTIQKYNAKALSVIWFAKNTDGSYELLDGQQRTLSICQYVNGDFSINNKFFQNLPRDAQERLLDQELLIQVFEGTETEKLEWFRTINIAGEQLTEQEMRNAVELGDDITTISGIVGKVVAVKEDSLIIETGADRNRLTIKRWSVQANNTATERLAAERAAAKEAAEKARAEKKSKKDKE
jgi:preprotein translocase subunit YajC